MTEGEKGVRNKKTGMVFFFSFLDFSVGSIRGLNKKHKSYVFRDWAYCCLEEKTKGHYSMVRSRGVRWKNLDEH